MYCEIGDVKLKKVVFRVNHRQSLKKESITEDNITIY